MSIRSAYHGVTAKLQHFAKERAARICFIRVWRRTQQTLVLLFQRGLSFGVRVMIV